MKNLLDIKYWIFDLDNTLYSGQTKVFSEVDKKMSAFISKKMDVDLVKAKEIQKKYFYEYGTTLSGLMKQDNIDPHDFLEFVHDIDISWLPKDLKLKEELIKIKEKKYIFTNGSHAHVKNITKQLGIDGLFDGVFDIVDSDFYPKPSIEPYKKIIENYKIQPEYCIFFEDIARNLKPAYELGMKTVWIENNEPWAAKYSDEKFVNFKTRSLTNFLKGINEYR